MKRRDVLAATGLGIAGAAGAWYLFADQQSADVKHAGSLDATIATNGNFPDDDDPADGYPPEFPDSPDPPDVDPATFETNETEGEPVKLAPIDVVSRWYYRREARVVDARLVGDYEHSHVYGAVNSAAQRDSSGGGVEGWSTDDRIVTYCRCPHHLSSLRAAGFMKAGYDRVYALDEGFGAWNSRGYPMAGTAFTSDGGNAAVREYTLNGVVDPEFAGEYAWVRTETNQEAAPIGSDGTFTLHVKFPDVTDTTQVEVSTPAYSVSGPLGELATGTIDGP